MHRDPDTVPKPEDRAASEPEERQAETAGFPGAPARPIRILILNQVFWPDVAATAQHAFDLARYLTAHGDRVTVIASRSIYGQPGSVLPSEETVDGVVINRVGSSVFGKRRVASRLFDSISFNAACLLKAFRLGRPDVVVCLTTPPFIALIGVALRLVRRCSFVFWTMDLYPDIPVAAGVIKGGSLAHRILDVLDRICLGSADAVVVLGRCMRERIVSKGIDPHRIHVIPPWSDPAEVRDVPARPIGGAVPNAVAPMPAVSAGRRAGPGANPYRVEWDIGDRFVIQYSGNCGVGHDVRSVCDAMLAMRDDDSLRWVFVGGGVMKPVIEEHVRRHSIANVVLRPYQPRNRLGELIALGDAHLVLVADGFSGLLIPSKFYGILAAARPAIYVGPSGSEVARVILEEECGIVVANRDGPGLVDAVRALQRKPAECAAMGGRGRHALVLRYSMQIACERWRACLHDVVGE